MEQMLIGAFSKQTGLSIRALHLYDHMGLLKPATIAKHNKYRYYEPEQLVTAQKIKTYRKTNLALELIKEIIENPLIAKTTLTTHLETLRQKLVTDQMMIMQLEQLIMQTP
jgi:DNA-binding transcriptional MerR regulator